MTPASDAELLDTARAGDADAAAALVERYAARVLRFARGLCDDPVTAEDAAQEALIAAIRGIGSVRDAAAIPAWLYAVTRSQCGRQRRGHVAAEPLDDVPVASGARGPEGDAAGREVAGALTQALRTMDPKYREVVWLRDVEGLTAPEVADALGLEVAAVKTRLHRGRGHLRDAVEPTLASVGPACPEIGERFSRFLEGEIGPDECAALEAHVASCAACNAACASLKRTIGACMVQGAAVPPDVAERVRRALAIVVNRAP